MARISSEINQPNNNHEKKLTTEKEWFEELVISPTPQELNEILITKVSGEIY